MGKHVAKKRKSHKIISMFLIIYIIIFLISMIEIIKWYTEISSNKKLTQELAQSVTVNESNDEGNKYVIDFNTLKQKNSEIVAWLKVNGTEIEYTVVQGNNNEYYLSHNVENEYNQAGWIFADYKNNLDGKDRNVIVYGHNMRDGSMFGSLNNILTQQWYDSEENRKIYFITENEYYIYEVFSVYEIENEDYYIKTSFEAGEFLEYINTIKGRSITNFEVDVQGEDNILTLSTCANNNNYRVVLHAKCLNTD